MKELAAGLFKSSHASSRRNAVRLSQPPAAAALRGQI